MKKQNTQNDLDIQVIGEDQMRELNGGNFITKLIKMICPDINIETNTSKKSRQTRAKNRIL